MSDFPGRDDIARESEWFDTAFAGHPVMAILRGFGPARTLELATVAWGLGLTAVEVPIQSDSDVEALAATVVAGREQGFAVGAGTVLTHDDVRRASEAGAAFTVSPGLDLDVVRWSLDAGMPTLPGVATATEIQRAVKFGLDWLKAFPASELGTGWFTGMKGPFPAVRFAATGGLSAHNAQSFLSAGASVVAVGSALTDPSQLHKLAELAIH